MHRNIQFTSYYQFSSLHIKRTEFTLILGDLCLLCDLPSESWSHYETAMEILRSCNDWIWLAGNLHFFYCFFSITNCSSWWTKPLLWLTETQNGRYRNWKKPHFKGRNLVSDIMGIFSIMKLPVKPNFLPNIEDF